MERKNPGLNLFVGIDTIRAFLEEQKTAPELRQVLTDCAFTVDILDMAHRLFYRANPESAELILDQRGSMYMAEEKENQRLANLTLNQKGEVRGKTPDELQDPMQIYLLFCLKMSIWLQEHGVFEQYADLNPERQGLLAEDGDDGFALTPVSDHERPDLVCRLFSGELQLMRPYEADMMREVILDAMPLERKEAEAEAGDTKMMQHLFRYYMGNYTSAHKDLEKMMKMTSGEVPEEEDTRNPEKAFYWLKKLAESGDVGSMNILAMFYARGFGTERDFQKAAEWKKAAAENGDAASSEDVEVFLEIDNIRQAAAAGNPGAQARYAIALMKLSEEDDALGGERDREEAFRWAQKSASKFELDGIFTLAKFYENGTGTEKDNIKAFRLYERAANKGHAPSQAKLAMMYYNGTGTEENPKAAFEWAKKAAEAGDINGMSNLAVCYLFGKGVEKDQEKAVEWFRKAAAQGEEGAKRFLEQNNIPPESQPQTVEEAQQMAEEGSVTAMKLLANYYISRPGGKEDLYEAHRWAKKAADLGDEEARQMVESLEASFRGETISFEEARIGAENGDPGAQKILADYYATGYKTDRDLVKALFWMKKAASSGDPRYAGHAKSFVDSFSDIEEIVAAAERGDLHAKAQLAERYIVIFQNNPNYDQEKGQRDAFAMAQIAAEGNDPFGLYVFGTCYENGYGTEIDYNKAFALYQRSAELGDPRGELSLSQCYLVGKGTEIDADATVKWLRKSEEHEDPEAEQVRELHVQLMLVVAMDKLSSGEQFGGPDPVQGVKLMQYAAEFGNNEAQYYLGMMYLNGSYVEKDLGAALEWLTRAAEGGNKQAADMTAKLDLPQFWNRAANMEASKKDKADRKKVFRLMERAAEGGMAASQSSLGSLYMTGFGTEPDYAAGMEWFRKAAEQGYEKAIQSIRLYESADGWYMAATAVFAAYKNGRITDSAEGFELLKKALDAGLPEAMNMMGIFCADEAKAAKTFGVTVREDREKAKSLFEAALALKPELAKAENNLKKVTDLIEAEKAGREPNSELKWQIALKKPGDAR